MFYVASLVLGIPSALLFVVSTWGSVQLHFSASPKATSGPPTGNSIIDGLTAGATLLAQGFSFAGNAAGWVLTGAAVASFVLTADAAILFMTSRGLNALSAWARVLGIVLALAPLLSSILLVTSLGRPLPIALGAGGALLAGYTIWVLGWRFA